ncbi:MAG: Adenylate kinase [Ktedonobacterales bacterium]|jgi:adenylate kinase|nr:MAG: Adenylate kinase [Ktedonobacterales bacterium]
MNIILLGAQGSGKGTQADMLSQALRLKPCASGELLREAIAKGTPLGQIAKPYYDRGDLVPDDLVAGMILESLSNLGDAKGIILDGFPRNSVQAELLDRRFAEMGQRIDAVIYLEVPRDMLFDRLAGRYVCQAHGHVWNIKTHQPRIPGICDYDGSALFHRSDDTPEKIAHRLDIFFHETIQLVDYYGARGKLIRVDGAGDIGEVNRAIRAQLALKLNLSGGMPLSAQEESPAGD